MRNLLTARRKLWIGQAAANWCDALPSQPAADDYADVARLATAAFTLYYLEWPDKSIRDWKWPADQLHEASPFDGGDCYRHPWSVLFARAYALATAK